ncbi:MAG: MopE-related protein [Myxococcota bacterium]|nr:MopE-related protein [Myxococcota bacterium]
MLYLLSCAFVGDAELSFRAQKDCEATYFYDSDADGYGDPQLGICSPNDGYVPNSLDCDDTNPLVAPNQQEDCYTDEDDDCDGVLSQENALNCRNWYSDRDADGFAGGDEYRCLCSPSEPYLYPNALDCDDDDAAVSPAAEEVCFDEIDNNCDLSVEPCTLFRQQDVEDATVHLSGWQEQQRVGERLFSLADGFGLLASGFEDGKGAIFVDPLDFGGSLSESPFHLVGEESNSNFGSAAIRVGLDTDSLLVGASTGYGQAANSGVVYLFFPTESRRYDSEYADGVLVGHASGDRFGESMESGSLLGNRTPEVLIGAPGAFENDGAIYIFTTPLMRVTLVENAAHIIRPAEPHTQFGYAIAPIADFTGDGIGDLVASAPQATGGNGEVYLFSPFDETDIFTDQSVGTYMGSAGEEAGRMLIDMGDVDRDGLPDLLIAGRDTLYLLPSLQSGTTMLSDSSIRFSDLPSEGGWSADAVPDMHGDGSPELLIGVSSLSKAFLFYGAFTGHYALEDSDVQFSCPDSFGCGNSVLGIEHAEDPFGDVLIGASQGEGRVLLYTGGLW